MPHVIVEHSSDIDVKLLLPKLHDLVAGFDSVNPEAVKTRAAMYRFHTVSGSADTSFIHVELRLMHGRSEALKSSFVNALFALVKEFSKAEGGSVAISTHVSELIRDVYRTELI